MISPETTMVRMRDGVRLATDVYRPEGAGPFPVILERTPYGRHLPSRSERTAADPSPMTRAELAARFIARGYAAIYQDVRGRYGSEGGFEKYIGDGDDGVDTCAWLLAQPWCDGRIGTMGLSYAAHTQAALGSAGAPGVRAMVLDSGGFADATQGGIRQGGAFELKQVVWAWRNALESPSVVADPDRRAALAAVDLADWFENRRPWTRGHSPLSLAPEYEAYVFDQWERGALDDEWRRVGLYARGYYDRFPDAATLHISSWFDPYPQSAIDNALGLGLGEPGPRTARLILGPWTHGDRSVTFAGGVDFGPAATLDGSIATDYATLRLDWFDAQLRGRPTPEAAAPAVRAFIMGGGSGRRRADGRLDHGGAWVAASAWPLPGTRRTPWFLHADCTLRPAAPVSDTAPLAWQADPARPVRTRGGAVTSGEPLMRGGAFDQGAAARGPDVLSFVSAPLDAELVICGAIEAALWIASDAQDTDVTIKLIDVYPPSTDWPDGFAMNLTDDILRCRYRKSWTTPEPMTPGAATPIAVRTAPTANRFARGHRIRLDIASSNYPRFDINPNTAEPEARATGARVATNRLFVDAARASRVWLPVVSTLHGSTLHADAAIIGGD